MELIPLPGIAAACETAPAGVLRRNVPGGGLERPDSPRTDRLHALRTDGALPQADELAQIELAMLHQKGQVGPALVLKDPYILDFLGVRDHYQERDVEDAILREMELFLLEMGCGLLVDRSSEKNPA